MQVESLPNKFKIFQDYYLYVNGEIISYSEALRLYSQLDDDTKLDFEKFYKENCLLEQAFIKDGDKTVTDIINENIAKIGENINVRRFVRYGLGEGIEKRQDDFVAEVMASVGK